MTNDTYESQMQNDDQKLKFFFQSIGKEVSFKVIEYSLLTNYDNKEVYNLGFGDYNPETHLISDLINTNNGDLYKVFNTVLNTIPHFFSLFPYAIIFASGSDNSINFEDECKQTCKKKCIQICKNLNRRIKTYRYYINKNYKELSIEYGFKGGIFNDIVTTIEDYEVQKEYDVILVFKKS